MSRSAMFTLRVFALGSGLTVLACHVANKQNQATAVAGDRGAPGVEATVPGSRPTWAPSSKSIDSLISVRDTAQGKNEVDPSSDYRVITPSGVPLLPPTAAGPATPPPFAHGSKSAGVVSPSEVRQIQRRFAPGSKSAAVVSPADVQQLQQRSAPAQQTYQRQP